MDAIDEPGAASGERVDLVDEHDRVLGVVSRAEMRAGRLLHRCVFVAVVHPDGRLLVHRRSEHKDVWPGWFDIAVGGVVASGEDYDTAARQAPPQQPLITGRHAFKKALQRVIDAAMRRFMTQQL